MDQKRIQDLRARIEKNPKNILDRFVLSKIYYDGKMWNEAIAEATEILKLKPDYLVVHIQLGDSLLQIGEKEEAKKILEKAHELAIAQNHMGMVPEIDDLIEETK